jgi:hypothetical protein
MNPSEDTFKGFTEPKKIEPPALELNFSLVTLDRKMKET